MIDDVLLNTWIDESVDPKFFLHLFSIDEIGQLEVFKDVFGYGDDIVSIMIYTKTGNWNRRSRSFNIKPVMPLGYQLPVDFYSPKYDTQESIYNPTPDLRTTIFWKPNVLTDDEGNARLDFYTADDPGTYSVIIEGVSDAGKLIHYRNRASIVVK